MLTDAKIEHEAATTAAYTNGCQYHRKGSVQQIRFHADNYTFNAHVMGNELYEVTVQLDQKYNIKDYDCDCPAFFNYFGACKHVVAVLKAIQTDWEKYFVEKAPPTVPLSRPAQELLAFFQSNHPTAIEATAQAPIKIVPTFAVSITPGAKLSWLEFVIGADRTYVVRDIPQLLAALDNNQELVFGKNFTLKPLEMMFDDLSGKLLDMMRQAYTEERQRAAWGYYGPSNSAFTEPRRFKLTNANLLRFFAVMSEQRFDVIINNQPTANIIISAGRPPLSFNVKAVQGGIKLGLDLADDVLYALDVDCRYMYHNKMIYKPDDVFANYIKPILKCFSQNKQPEILIPTAAVSDFFSAMLPALEAIAAVEIDEAVYARFYKEPLEKTVYLDRFESGMSARIEFRYGAITINPAVAAAQAKPKVDGKCLLRDTSAENQLIGILRRHGFSQLAEKFVQADEAATYDFLQQALPELRDMADVFYSDDFRQIKIQHTDKITAGVRLNTETDMLELSLQYEGMTPKELLELLSAYKLKKRYYRLQDGAFIPLDSPEFQTAARLIEELGVRSADIEKQVIALPKYRALYLDSLARETDDFHIERSSAFKKMVQDIREPQDIECTVPEGIQGKLRDYQKTGFKWLKSLASYGLGGILADDMGLGKTLQVLTFILSEKNADSTPSLVIAPTSLVYNWQDEALKFVPSLKVAVISGQQDERLEQLQQLEQADLVVTSYALIKRDIHLYKDKTFKYCFLDEAQHVKNPNTLNAKSVKKINAKSYFALTGTPIENTLTELWSIFDFIMPGYLRTHKTFTSRFEIPIVKNGDQQALQQLGRHIKPFILRRMKKTVLKELPEKMESKMTNEMTDEQAKLYHAWLLKARSEFEQEIQANGLGKSQIKILSLLTRLRQICCHPSLFIENYLGGSGKLEMLLEILKDAASGGHRVLLFSQFTGMLGLIKQELTAQHLSYHYLDGATKAEERIKLVHSFNAGAKDIFLISLKAGGTGLNLTGADMVIHYDPWWNPAVEEQATDRAYRIGQQNSVQVYKLITKNTIEEKIYILQQKKKEMIDTLIQPGESFLTKMNEAEIRELFDC